MRHTTAVLVVVAVVLASLESSSSASDAYGDSNVAWDEDMPHAAKRSTSPRRLRTITPQLIQAHRDLDSLDSERRAAIARWRDLNPHLTYRFFNDTSCHEYVTRKCGDEAGTAYAALRPGAFRADLFR
jgi:mannosyltransferase OCH1-like enzyme